MSDDAVEDRVLTEKLNHLKELLEGMRSDLRALIGEAPVRRIEALEEFQRKAEPLINEFSLTMSGVKQSRDTMRKWLVAVSAALVAAVIGGLFAWFRPS